MALAENFAIIENDPDWKELTLPEQNQIRREWIIKRQSVSNRSRDPALRKQLETEAFAGAPEFARPLDPDFWERNPRLTGALKTAYGVPMKLLETPQQLVANIINPALRGERYPATFGGALQSLIEPLKRTGEWMTSQREETELPGGEISRFVTDPLMYTGVGELAAVRAAKRGIPAGVKAIPSLGKKAAERELKATLSKPGLSQIIEEIPRSWATWDLENRSLYTQIMQRGQQHIPKEQLQRVAETIVNAPPEEAKAAFQLLQSGKPNDLRKLVAWTEAPYWKRKILGKAGKGGSAVKTPTGAAEGGGKTVVEEMNQPGGLADYMERLMTAPSLD